MERDRSSGSGISLALVVILSVVGIPLLCFFPKHSGEWKVGGGLLAVSLAFCVVGFMNADAAMARARREYESQRRY